MRKNPKDLAYLQFARIGKALSSPNRLELIDLLCQGEKTVDTLCQQSGLEFKNTSAQLKALKQARLIESRKQGKYVYYRLADGEVAQLWLSLRALAESRLEEVREITETFFSGSNSLSAIDQKTLLAKARRGDVILLDVRPRDEFDAGHLPSAVSIPISELKKRIDALPKSKEIIAYCRGPYCVWAAEAADLLKKRGFRASHIKPGVTEWKQDGFEIELSQES